MVVGDAALAPENAWALGRVEASQSILPNASCVGLGIVVGCGLVFCVAFGCSALAVVSFSFIVLGRVRRWFGVCRAACVAVSFAQVVGRVWCWLDFSALVLVVLRVRWFRYIFPLVRRLLSVDPVEIWTKNAKVAS